MLGYAGAEIVHEACARVPVSREMVGAPGLVEDQGARDQIATVIQLLAAHVTASSHPQAG